MRSLVALIQVTIRSLIRTKIALALIFFIFLSSIVLPLTIVSDGTAHGLVQVSFTYALGLNALILSIIGVWLSANVMAEDIESYRIHMIYTKPVSSVIIWGGKWLGVSLFLVIILLISLGITWGIVHYRLQRLHLSEQERRVLYSRVLTARRMFKPSPIDYKKWAEQELERRLAAGATMPPQLSKEIVIDSILQQLKRGEGDVAYRGARPWEIRHLPSSLSSNDMIFLRYRIYVSGVKEKEQTVTQGLWIFENPQAKSPQESYITVPCEVMGGTIQELPLPGWLVFPDRSLRFQFVNLDPREKTVVIPQSDGPFLLIGKYSFLNNYGRVFSLIVLQIIVGTALGCAAGSTLSSPVAIFISIAYILIGFLLSFLRILDEQNMMEFGGSLAGLLFSLFRKLVQLFTFSFNTSLNIDYLIDGILIENTTLLWIFLRSFVFHLLPMALVGIVIFNRRELGLVIRK